MNIVDRQNIVDKVYKKFDGAISKLALYDALQAICEDLENRIVDGQSVSISNFGTFHQYEYKTRKTVDINSGELRETQPFINIRFVPDKTFSDLIIQRKAFFNKTDMSDNTNITNRIKRL